MKYNSILINDVDMEDAFGLILYDKKISAPEPQVNYIEIPMRDGAIDLTESVSGSVRYRNREIALVFVLQDDVVNTISRVYQFCHGKKVKIVFGDDPNFYYEGRLTFNGVDDNKESAKLSASVYADPFKYDVEPSTIDWEWDTFDFDTGLINELGELEVNGELEVSIMCRRNLELPTFIASTAMTLEFEGVSYEIKQGEQKLYRVLFKEGLNTFKIIGNGTINIIYIGGSL